MTSKEALKRLWQETAPATYMTDFDKKECCDVIERDLEVLEILKRIVKIVDYSKHPIDSLDNQLFILSGGMITNVEDYDKIKEWLKETNNEQQED